MSLAISVGVLAGGPHADPAAVAYDLKAFEDINRVLAENELPLHEEPRDLPEVPYRGHLISFPYAWLPYLYRAVAYARRAPGQFAPVRPGENPAKDKQIDRELYTFAESHLICHSDTEGYFVPIDFPFPISDSREGGLPGRVLGSSQQALKELVRTAPLIGIELQGQELSDEVASLIVKEPDESHPFWIERKVWLAMFEPFRYSVQNKCAVVYG